MAQDQLAQAGAVTMEWSTQALLQILVCDLQVPGLQSVAVGTLVQ